MRIGRTALPSPPHTPQLRSRNVVDAGQALLEAHDNVVSEPNDEHVTVCIPLPPLVSPQIEAVVKVDIRQQRANAAPLWRTFLHLMQVPVFHYASIEPLPHVT